jgi:hypothetical protein
VISREQTCPILTEQHDLRSRTGIRPRFEISESYPLQGYNPGDIKAPSVSGDKPHLDIGTQVTSLDMNATARRELLLVGGRRGI